MAMVNVIPAVWVRENLKVFIKDEGWVEKPLNVYKDGEWKNIDIRG